MSEKCWCVTDRRLHTEFCPLYLRVERMKRERDALLEAAQIIHTAYMGSGEPDDLSDADWQSFERAIAACEKKERDCPHVGCPSIGQHKHESGTQAKEG